MKVLHAAGLAARAARWRAVAGRRPRGPPAPLDPQNWSFQDNLTWTDYKPLPGPDYSDPSDPADGQEVEGRARPDRLPGQAVHDHAARGQHGLRHADGRGAQTSRARRSRAFYARLPQQAAGAEPLPDDEPVLDGGLLRQVRRRSSTPSARTSCPGNSYQYFMTDVRARNAERALPGRRRRDAVQPELPHRRARRVAGRRRRGEDRRVRQHLLRLRRRGRVRHLAGVRRDEVHDAGRRSRRVRPEGLRP